MNSSQLTVKLFVGILGIVVYVLFLFLFYKAIFKTELIFRGGIIRGRLAQTFGVIGMLGITAGAYLGISLVVFHVEPPGMPAAMFLLLLFCFMAIGLKFASIFWHPK